VITILKDFYGDVFDHTPVSYKVSSEMTCDFLINPLVLELNAWCDVQETGI
jgi:hypothetical protein